MLLAEANHFSNEVNPLLEGRAQTPLLTLRGLQVRPRGDLPVVAGPIDLSIAPGEIVALMGANGCGKSTLLRRVALVDRLRRADVEVSPEVSFPLGVVVQNAGGSLFPWLSLAANCSLAARASGRTEPSLAELTKTAAAVGVPPLPWHRRPLEVSGGEAQLACIVRAVCAGSRLFLLDEPFSQVDAPTLVRLLPAFRSWSRRVGAAVLVTTHSAEAAEVLADRILILAGKPAKVVEVVQQDDRRRTTTRLEERILELTTRVEVAAPLVTTPRSRWTWPVMLVGVLLVFSWWLVATLQLVAPYLFPGPVAVFWALISESARPDFLIDLAWTSGRAIGSFFFVSFVGLSAGLWLGQTRRLWGWIEPWVDVLRAVPAPLLLPILAVFLGLSESARFITIAAAGLWINVVYAASASRNLPVARLESARWLGLDREFGMFVWKYLVPETLPALVASARVTVAVSWVLAVVVEMYGGARFGLGAQFMLADALFATPRRFALLLVIAVLAASSNVPLRWIENRYCSWSKVR